MSRSICCLGQSPSQASRTGARRPAGMSITSKPSCATPHDVQAIRLRTSMIPLDAPPEWDPRERKSGKRAPGPGPAPGAIRGPIMARAHAHHYDTDLIANDARRYNHSSTQVSSAGRLRPVVNYDPTDGVQNNPLSHLGGSIDTKLEVSIRRPRYRRRPSEQSSKHLRQCRTVRALSPRPRQRHRDVLARTA